MHRRLLLSIPLALASVFAAEAVSAAPLSFHSPRLAMSAKPKLVKFSLRNDGTSPVTLEVGAQTMTLEAGKTQNLELPVGARVVRKDATPTEPAGTVITEVSKELSGVTIALKG